MSLGLEAIAIAYKTNLVDFLPDKHIVNLRIRAASKDCRTAADEHKRREVRTLLYSRFKSAKHPFRLGDESEAKR